MREVLNTPSYATECKYIVARECENELWFWGAYDDVETARKASREVGGVVIER